MNPTRAFVCSFGLLLSTLHADSWKDYFTFEKIKTPAGVDSQVGAMGALPDGRLAVAFHRGELMIYQPKDDTWTLFGSGLQEPLGMLVESPDKILVMQRAELTRLTDTDGDGKADRYETVYDDFGMTGNYHEFSYGPVKDKEGNLYVVLGVASNGSPIRKEIRGEFSNIGELSREEMTEAPGKDWGKFKDKSGRMYSRASYRGWLMKISPDGSVEPYASGFRSPNGIGFDAKGRLLVTDNQGDWRPTSPLYNITEGGFYGHPASLVWSKGWKGKDPLKMDVSKLDKMQVPAAGYFPQGELANSPTQPIVVPEGAMPEGMTGETIVGEMNQNTLIRVLDDEVDGTFQTGLVPFLKDSPLGHGNHRLAFTTDKSLYVGKTALSWAGGTGITRIRWNGKQFFTVDKIKALPDGFALKFSEPVDPKSVSGLKMERHTYEYHADYGSPKIDEKTITIDDTELSSDGLTLTLKTGPLKQNYLHQLILGHLHSKDGSNLMGGQIWYQVVKVPR
ncbi:hypothetical protein JIN85_11870 [Luteolibacter pohnpeiensis]|uniref:DUF7133 domain-containing protein n=1 Tax=Luteolibacter pohnpeiensis TaxID=454153 RepID=A0A934VWS9_9BACT|nr:hypothetical protein [Luteolibacter pohnpeiensis]MBK1883118.1 hypothetical protein [Luteolibacter pohnpeiensis]